MSPVRVIRLDACRDRGLRLDGLLIELGRFLAAPVESFEPTGRNAPGCGGLNLDQPAQGFETGLQHRRRRSCGVR